jgi:glycosyltransferase involved in cell wall biosynthesis
MVKVLVVNIASEGGGAETVLRNLTGALAGGSGGGLQVDTFSKDAYSRNRPGGKLAGYASFLRELRARSIDYDVVMSGVEGIPFLLCQLALFGRARPVLAMWLHCNPVAYLPFQNWRSRLAIGASLMAARRILCAAPAEAARLCQRGKDALYLPNFRRPDALRQDAPVPRQVVPRLAFVGSLAPLKQPLKTIALLAWLDQRGGTAYHLDLFGAGALAGEVAGLIERSGQQRCVTVHGFVANPWSRIAPGSILLLPSLTEAMPMVVLEAFEHGCVVIANTFAGHAFFQGHDGLFLAADFTDIDSVARCVDACAAWSEPELAQRVARSRAFVRAEFDNQRSVAAMRGYLERIAAA